MNDLKSNYGIAMKYYQQAANMGLPIAMMNIGALYGNGRGVPVNYELALHWYRLALKQFNSPQWKGSAPDGTQVRPRNSVFNDIVGLLSTNHNKLRS